MEETGRLPTVTALSATGFPTGKFKNLDPGTLNTDVLGAPYVFTPGFDVSKCMKPFIVYGNLWFGPGGHPGD